MDYEPLTADERAEIQKLSEAITRIEREDNTFVYSHYTIPLIRYEATVRALEAEIARLRSAA